MSLDMGGGGAIGGMGFDIGGGGGAPVRKNSRLECARNNCENNSEYGE